MVIIKNYPNIIKSEQISLLLEQLNKCICKVYSDKFCYATGFLCFVPFNNKKLPVLIFPEHLIEIERPIIIELELNNNIKKITLTNDRIIYTNKKYEIAIIEINPDKDFIYNFLELDENIFEVEKALNGTTIYSLQLEKRISFGIMKGFYEKDGEIKISHLCSTVNGSSGSPLMNLNTGKIIGMHVSSSRTKNYNIGTFLKYPINEFITNFKNNINSKEKIISKTYSIVNYSKNEEQILDFENKINIIENELKLEKEKKKILENKIIQLQKLLDNNIKNNTINLDILNSNELLNELLKKEKEIEEIKLKLEAKKYEKSKEFYSPSEEREEKKRIQRMKKEILKKEKINRNIKKEIKGEKEKNNKIKDILENMCIYGNILKKEIEEEKKKNPKQFISIEEAVKSENNDQELFALVLIAKELKKIGVEALIEKDGIKENDEEGEEEEEEEDEEEEDEEEELTCLNFLLNGLNNRIKKYDLHFDFGEKKNNELLKSEKEYNNFKEKLKLKLSKEYKISVDKIIITFPQRGSLHVQLIFQSEEFNNLNMEQFKIRFNNDPEFTELNFLKEIHRDLLIGQCKLSKKFLDPEGNRSDDWGIDEERGNMKYYPPINWIGIGIKVIDKYDNGNNEWIGMDNTEGEWCVAYHGLCGGFPSEDVKRITGNIVKGDKLKPGEGQLYEESEDLNHSGNKVGIGVYVTPQIDIAEEYAGISEINGVEYYTVLMVRVKPSSIRHCEEEKDYWVLESDEIRPYRILYKKRID